MAIQIVYSRLRPSDPTADRLYYRSRSRSSTLADDNLPSARRTREPGVQGAADRRAAGQADGKLRALRERQPERGRAQQVRLRVDGAERAALAEPVVGHVQWPVLPSEDGDGDDDAGVSATALQARATLM